MAATYARRAAPPKEIFADVVQMAHDPRSAEFDGAWSRELLSAHNASELDGWIKAMPDFRFEDIQAQCSGREFVISLRLVGTPPDGAPMNMRAQLACEVADEKIISITTRLEAAR